MPRPACSAPRSPPPPGRASRARGIVAGSDQIINPDLERFYYERAGAPITVIAGASHSVYESHPREVAAVIEQAARELGKAAD
ncbi:alpha/beta fold hydrolase [Ancylobacter dichloromethanicus]